MASRKFLLFAHYQLAGGGVPVANLTGGGGNWGAAPNIGLTLVNLSPHNLAVRGEQDFGRAFFFKKSISQNVVLSQI